MNEVLALSKPLWEIALRATVIYFALVILMRVVPKRNAGHISPNDMVILIVIGAIATDGIVGGSESIIDILLMIGIVMGWGYVTDQLEYRIPAFRRLFRHGQTTLVQDGRMLKKNLSRELITEEELMAILRAEGVEDLSKVRSACLEADGQVSVIRKEEGA